MCHDISILTMFGSAPFFNSSSRISFSPNPVAIRTGVSLYCKNRRCMNTVTHCAHYIELMISTIVTGGIIRGNNKGE